MGIPACDGVVEPGDEVVLGLRMMSFESTTDEDALDGLGHVQPGATERGVQWHDAVVEQPADDRPTQMAGQVVPNQEESERRHRLGRLMAEPGCPPRQGWPRVLGQYHGRQARQHLSQFGPEPGVQHRVRRPGDTLGADLTSRGTEQRQQLGRPTADVLMRAERWLPHRRPVGPRLRDGLVWPRFILAPQRQAGRLC